MKLLRQGMTMDIACDNEIYIIADHANFKYYKLKKNKYIDFILEATSNPIKKDELIRQAIEVNLEEKNIEFILKKLIDMSVIEISNFPDETDIEKLAEFKMPEQYFSERFGLEIAYYAGYETNEVSRFEIFKRIQNARIVIIGAGGLGSNIAVMAASAGIGEITIIDDDYVETSNLVRQIFYTEADCGKVKKVIALKRFINNFTSYTKVNAIEDYVTDVDSAKKYIKDATLVIQAADTPKGIIDRIVNKACIDNKVPVVFSHFGSVGPFYIPNVSACFKCFEKYVDEDSNGLYSKIIDNMDGNISSVYPASVTGPWLNSYYLFQEIFRFISGAVKPLSLNGIISFKNGKISIIKFKQQDDCICK